MQRVTVGLLGALLLWAPSAARAQMFSLWPQIQRPTGGSLELESRDGDRCRQHRGDRASVSIAGLGGAPDRPLDSGDSYGIGYGGLLDGIGGGVMVSVPFGGGATGDCRRLLQLQEARSELELARSLMEEGLMNQEQYEALGQRLRQQVFSRPGP